MDDWDEIEWDGTSIPERLCQLPAGRYILAPADYFDDLSDRPEKPYTAIDDLHLGNGATTDDVLLQLQALVPGRYTVESADEVVTLSPEEEAGILEAIAQVERGEVIPFEDVVREFRSRYSTDS